MMLRKWEDLPQEMRTEEVRPYYDLLRKKQGSLLCKRLFDILASLVLLVLLRLTAANGHTRCVDLAAALELSPPSVHNMVDTMTALGLVKKGTRGAVSLTEYGSRTAERYQRYYHSAAALLRQGFPELTEPQTMICQLLAQVPEESLAGLCDRQEVEEAAS